jgi:nucleotide-binding universal stress UspA family protein
MKILLAVDGSKNSTDAVGYVIEHWKSGKPRIELVTVHRPVPKLPGMGAAVGKSQIARYYEEEGEQCLAEAKKRLDRAGIGYEAHILVGDPAETLSRHAKSTGCDLICIGAPAALVGSVATKVLHLSDTPVLLVK